MNFRSSGSLRIGTAVGQKVNNNMGGLFDVTAQQSPTRGTLFKSPSSGMPTFWHESIGPQFSTGQSVFSVKHGNTLNKNPSRISYDTMSRLMQRPAHKTDRIKYDNTSQKCLSQKRNTTQTAEDAFERTDVQWITSLRPLDPNLNTKSARYTKGSKNAKGHNIDIKSDADDEDKNKRTYQTEVVPPGFYDEDMEKWQNKFKTARESRQQHKQMLKSMGCF